MELRNLTTFLAVAQTKSFSQAALALNYAQSTVTAQIQTLEDELGVLLFDRLGRHIAVTEAGKRLLDYAQQLVDLEKQARTVLAGDEEPVGSLTIGASETICTYRLPPVLRQFRSSYPRVQLMFRPLAFVDLVPGVRDGSIDVALLIQETAQSPVLNVSQIARERLVLVAEPGHYLTRVEQVYPLHLENETILYTERTCSYRRLFEQMVCEAGICLTANMEFSSIEAIKQCVMAGLGIAVLPEIAVARELARGDLAALPWYKPDWSAATLMVWHKEKWMSPALKAFIRLVHETFPVNQGVLA
ncbi:MAG: LysR family transcriptional regulator [Chloroflexi bacterium]|nr:LysR family transcriptional regulator [Chloroflexota bacterium]